MDEWFEIRGQYEVYIVRFKVGDDDIWDADILHKDKVIAENILSSNSVHTTIREVARASAEYLAKKIVESYEYSLHEAQQKAILYVPLHLLGSSKVHGIEQALKCVGCDIRYELVDSNELILEFQGKRYIGWDEISVALGLSE